MTETTWAFTTFLVYHKGYEQASISKDTESPENKSFQANFTLIQLSKSIAHSDIVSLVSLVISWHLKYQQNTL